MSSKRIPPRTALRAWLEANKHTDQSFAAALVKSGTKAAPGTIRNVADGHAQPGYRLACAIERLTGIAVARLKPDSAA